jgi:hypothetical protein
MANHIKFNAQTPYGAMLRSSLRTNEDADLQFTRVRDVMIQMRDGDGSQEAHYAIVQAEFGFESNAKAKAAFEELDSAYSKTSGNGSVTNVRAARDQMFAKLRG